MPPPDFDELVGEDLDPAERERLRRVHDLLLAAEPPPEITPAHVRPSKPENVYPFLPRRRSAAAVAAAAALLLVAFGVGFLFGDRSAEDASPERVLAMVSPGGATHARASLAIFAKDDAGNWPMEVTVRDLRPLPAGRLYELWLTKDGKLAEPCGSFTVHAGKTVVPLNAPYKLREYDGWVVVRQGSKEPVLTT